MTSKHPQWPRWGDRPDFVIESLIADLQLDSAPKENGTCKKRAARKNVLHLPAQRERKRGAPAGSSWRKHLRDPNNLTAAVALVRLESWKAQWLKDNPGLPVARRVERRLEVMTPLAAAIADAVDLMEHGVKTIGPVAGKASANRNDEVYARLKRHGHLVRAKLDEARKEAAERERYDLPGSILVTLLAAAV